MFKQFSTPDLEILKLGECDIPSPLESIYVSDAEGVSCVALRSDYEDLLGGSGEIPYFEMAGPRDRIHFQPESIRCAIATCGGLCPGINDVIRGLTLMLEKGYGVREIYGLRYGYRGLIDSYGHEPVRLTSESVSEIHRRGGTILKSSRGQQDIGEMVQFLERRRIDVLFTIGGEGTQRGAAELSSAARKAGLQISCIGIPKTIDNDIPCIQKSFGFETAATEAVKAIAGAHIEAHDFPGGVAVVRLMGRDAGFIAAAATIASGDVNFCFVPEVDFKLDGENGLMQCLSSRLRDRGHAVLVVAEGAGKKLREAAGYEDIGFYIRDQIGIAMRDMGIEISLKYIDPSYMIRSVPANAHDSVFCARLAANAVHAAMTGRTDLVIGFYNDYFVHIPMELMKAPPKRLDPRGRRWRAVLESTGQPANFE